VNNDPIPDLRRFLTDRGADHGEIDRAVVEGTLSGLTVECILMPRRPVYDFGDVVARAGADPEIARRMWRAMGYPDLAPSERAFTDDDVAALERAAANLGRADLELTLQSLRLVSAAMARVAEFLTESTAGQIRTLRQAGLSDAEVAEAVSVHFDFDETARILMYLLRRQTHAAWRRTAPEGEPEGRERTLAVGFVDLVGFTALSQQLGEDELALTVDRFETLAYDTIAEHGGRVVKMIGDEVMFVADDAAAAARISLRLVEHRGERFLPDARAGVAAGTVVSHDGDYFGPVVNLASRLVNIAYPRTVVAAPSIRDALGRDPEFTWRSLKPRRLKGIGEMPLWVLRASGD